MRLLKKIAWIVGVMVLLSIIKFILNRVSPASRIFHVNLLTGLQWFLFLGLICWIILQFTWRSARKKDFSFGLAWLIFLIIISLGEWEASYLLRSADTVSKNTHGYLLKYYLQYERELAEVKSDCARYDPELTYTYKPGAACVQEGPEFLDTIYVNKAGLRDDDRSLVAPKVICLGDSYTMGSGVLQQQTYPQVLERLTGWNVLNAGISSYGTAREMMLLKRLDTSALEYLVIQFCFNDIGENNVYLKQGLKLPIRSEQAYQLLVNDHKWAMKYFPLKRVLTLSRMVVKDRLMKMFSGGQREVAINYNTSYVPAAAKQFIDIVYRSGIDFNKVKILVVDMNRYPVFDHRFIRAAQQTLYSGNYSEAFRQSVRFIDNSALNAPALFYPLDNHMNAAGHELMATLIRDQLLREARNSK